MTTIGKLKIRIVRTPGICGGKARIAGTRIPVWAIEDLSNQGASDDRIISEYPSLTDLDLIAARDYAFRNIREIMADIRANT